MKTTLFLLCVLSAGLIAYSTDLRIDLSFKNERIQNLERTSEDLGKWLAESRRDEITAEIDCRKKLILADAKCANEVPLPPPGWSIGNPADEPDVLTHDVSGNYKDETGNAHILWEFHEDGSATAKPQSE